MAYISSKSLLQDARKHHYAVGAFNVENMEMMQAVIEAATLQRAPVILQTTPSTIKYASTSVFAAMAAAMAEKAPVPIALHLDHGNSYELCCQAAEDGYTSVMIDGSGLPIEENITLVKRVVSMARQSAADVCVEAELGRLGGKEDALEVKEGEDLYTDPEEAVRFVEETKLDSLAIAIGTAHGFYKGVPKLDFDRLAAIRDAVSLPLVLHGSSGIPDEDIRRAVSLGICKVNFATELRDAYTKAVRACLDEDTAIYDPKKFGVPAREAVKELVARRICVCTK